MPWRLGEGRAKMQFLTSSRMPSLVHKAAAKTGKPSNTVYIQHALCEALARDLDIPIEMLLSELPSTRQDVELFGGTRHLRPMTSAANTVESVR